MTSKTRVWGSAEEVIRKSASGRSGQCVCVCVQACECPCTLTLYAMLGESPSGACSGVLKKHVTFSPLNEWIVRKVLLYCFFFWEQLEFCCLLCQVLSHFLGILLACNISWLRFDSCFQILWSVFPEWPSPCAEAVLFFFKLIFKILYSHYI